MYMLCKYFVFNHSIIIKKCIELIELISGMTDFAHLNDYIFQAIFEL